MLAFPGLSHREASMPSVTVVGAQWGDEGKAGIVDLLSEDAAWVVRFQGRAECRAHRRCRGGDFQAPPDSLGHRP